jgi:hypothetical protein
LGGMAMSQEQAKEQISYLQSRIKRQREIIDGLEAEGLPGSATRATWVLVLTEVTGLPFAMFAFMRPASHKLIAPFLAAGAWLCTGFGALVWFWR